MSSEPSALGLAIAAASAVLLCVAVAVFLVRGLIRSDDDDELRGELKASFDGRALAPVNRRDLMSRLSMKACFPCRDSVVEAPMAPAMSIDASWPRRQLSSIRRPSQFAPQVDRGLSARMRFGR